MEKTDKNPPQYENDIFGLAIKSMEESKMDKPVERTAIVIGEKGSGKSSLIAALVGEDPKLERKPTAGMDYKYTSKKIESKRNVGNFHEIGGGRLLSDLLKTALNPRKLQDMVLIITVDMSQPDTALHHLNYWLRKASEDVSKVFDEINNTNASLANDIRSKTAFQWEGHVDAKRVAPIGIPTIIVGTKYDVFGIEESENKKWLCRGMRFSAHVNGWDLTFWSYRDKDFDPLKVLINRHVYGSTKIPKIQADHGKILSIVSGQDKLTSIGDPPIPGDMSMDQAWIMSVESYFPLKNPITEEEQDNNLGDISKFSEPKVDAMKAQKDEELARSELYAQSKSKKARKVIRKADLE